MSCMCQQKKRKEHVVKENHLEKQISLLEGNAADGTNVIV